MIGLSTSALIHVRSSAIWFSFLAILAGAGRLQAAEPPQTQIGLPDRDITAAAAVTFEVMYTYDFANGAGPQDILLVPEHVTVNGSGTATAAEVTVTTGNLTVAYVTLSGIAGDGSLGISLAAGTARDNLGGMATAAGPSAVCQIDNTPPAGTIYGPFPTVTGGRTKTVTWYFHFDDATTMTGLTVYPEAVTTGSVSIARTSGESSSTLGTFDVAHYVDISGADGGQLAYALPEGFVTDAAGNPSPPVPASAPVSIDFAAPVISDFAATPAVVNGDTSVTITFRSSEPLCTEGMYQSHVYTIYPVTREATLVSVVGDTYTYEYMSGGYDAGDHDVRVEAVDAVQNFSPYDFSSAFHVDPYEPYIHDFAASLYVVPLGGEELLSFDAEDDHFSTAAVTVDGEPAAFVSQSGTRLTYSYIAGPASLEGYRNVQIVASDTVGNTATFTKTWAFMVDRTPPTFDISTMYGPYVSSASGAVIHVSVDEWCQPGSVAMTVGGVSAPLYQNWGNAWDFEYVPSGATPDGPKDVVVTGTDDAGNPGIASKDDLLTVDNTPPASSVSTPDSTVVGPYVSLDFVASDGSGSGLSSTTLMVKYPGSDSFVEEAGNYQVSGTSGVMTVYTFDPGRYAFATVASDNIYNLEEMPPVPDAVVDVNPDPATTMTLNVPVGDCVLVFPLSDDFDLTITLHGVTAPGTLSVLRISPFDTNTAPDHFRNKADLLREALQIVGGGGLLAGGFTADIEWAFDVALGPSGKTVNRVFRFKDGDLVPTVYVNTIGASGKLRVTGVDGFSTWYAGNESAVPVSLSAYALD